MTKCVRVPKRDGESVRIRLMDAGELDLGARIRADGDSLLIPVLCDGFEDLEVVDAEMQVQVRKPTDYREVADVPDDLRGILPSSFDVVGDVAMIKLPDELIPYKRGIGEALLEVNGNLRAVFADSGVKGEFRIRDLEQIAGTGSPETVHREFGVRLYTDPSKVYFNPRLSSERSRIASLVEDGETVIDMFAGVAPFGTVICRAANPGKVYSIDLNPEAERFARMNAEKNRAHQLVPMTGDSLKLIYSLPMADRIIMNLPQTADRFLGCALDRLKTGGTIHMYKIIEKEDFPRFCTDLGERMSELGFRIEMQTSELKTYSPTMGVYSLDILKVRSLPLAGLQGDPGLPLVMAAPLGVVPQGHGVQRFEHDLAEPRAYRQVHGLVGGVVGAERQRPLESRVDLPERPHDPLPYPLGLQPQLGADVVGHPDPFHRGDVEHGPGRDGHDSLPPDPVLAPHRDLRDPEVVPVRGQPVLVQVGDAEVAGHQALHDVLV